MEPAATRRIPNLGIGVGLRPIHYREILETRPDVDWFEIISENFMLPQGQNVEFLEEIQQFYPLVQHGVSLHIGSADPLDFDYLAQLKALSKKTKTPWISDHLSWGKVQGGHYHELLPLPRTWDVVHYVAERARIVQDYLELPFALENVSAAFSTTYDEISEWEFYGAVIEKSGVYMMLDVNDLYVSSRNLEFDPKEYYNNIPLERLIQIHLAGHTDRGDHLLNTHDHHVCDAVWEIYGEIYCRTRGVSTLLEWDDKFLPFADTWKEALKAKEYQKTLHRLSS